MTNKNIKKVILIYNYLSLLPGKSFLGRPSFLLATSNSKFEGSLQS